MQIYYAGMLLRKMLKIMSFLYQEIITLLTNEDDRFMLGRLDGSVGLLLDTSTG